ncbi:hypothetical protein [Sulfurivermis fontis]|uniref:hypothetical protein n=1 Tax=Sulfurivermis fontis TaxID=1972068 RepID=UPI0018D55832|nr:hypothetical protein [Sulfurivermis fontis]
MTDALASLPPVPETLVIGGESIDISPLKVGELPAFARAVLPIASKLGTDPDWLRLLSEDGDSVIAALAIACRRPSEWVSDLDLDEAIRLAEAVFMVNADFFVHRVAPEIVRASQTIGAARLGLTSSSDSSDSAIATPTS